MSQRPNSDRQHKEKIIIDSMSSETKPHIHFDGVQCPPLSEKREQRPRTSPIRSETRQFSFEETLSMISTFARTNNGTNFSQLTREMKLNALFTIDNLNNSPLYISLITGMKNAFYDFLSLLQTSGIPRQNYEQYLNIKNVNGMSAVHLAVLSGDENIFNSILATGAVNYNAYDARLRTIFHYLPETKFKLPEKLRYSKFSVQALNFCDSEGQTPLHIAIERENVSLLETYVEMGADTAKLDMKAQYSPLQYAAQAGNTSILKLILNRSRQGDINYQSPDGFTALYLAVTNNRIEAVDLLLAHKSDPMVLCFGSSVLSYTQPVTDTAMRSRIFNALDGDMDKWAFLNSRIDWEEDESFCIEY